MHILDIINAMIPADDCQRNKHAENSISHAKRAHHARVRRQWRADHGKGSFDDQGRAVAHWIANVPARGDDA